ncbi:guanylate kinase [Utexia brackfieldae]|uniref:guanylate kinase n=1 Tax=Utexia brackfieldae TaxID=3074108 RepID=UPI00370D32FD
MQEKLYSATLFIISAPSGAGKSSLINAYLNTQTTRKTKVSISHTTRDSRPGEQDGQHYHFVDKTTFEQMIAQQAFIEYAKVYDNYYGTSRQAIEGCLEQNIDVFLDIDWQGAQQVRQAMPDAKSIFILPPSLTELENRLIKRGQDSEEIIKKRMLKAQSEISHYAEYDYLIINDDFNHSLTQLQMITQVEKLKTDKQSLINQKLIAELMLRF